MILFEHIFIGVCIGIVLAMAVAFIVDIGQED
jgi:hypothetical protein